MGGVYEYTGVDPPLGISLARGSPYFASSTVAILSRCASLHVLFFFFQAEDGIRDESVTGVQTCAFRSNDTATTEIKGRVGKECRSRWSPYHLLARAERERQAAAREERRQQLLRKELAWLRRGPPARTAKPKFRIEAANALIADEPEPRDKTELLRFATTRLGTKVIDAEHVSLAYGDRRILNDVTWQLGPGDRVALVGVNGSGKSTLTRGLAQELAP